MQQSSHISPRLDRLGFGKFQLIVFVAVGLCMSADAMEVTLLSYLSAILKEEWNLSNTESAAITSSVFAGQLVGSLFLGPLGDKIGRRPVFILAGSIISIFGLLTAVAWDVPSLVVLRMLVGVGCVSTLILPFVSCAIRALQVENAYF
jgi:MFS family permease